MDQHNLIAVYETAGGSTVEVSEHAEEIVAICGGCPSGMKAFPLDPLREGHRMFTFVTSTAEEWAQAHGAACRARPRS